MADKRQQAIAELARRELARREAEAPPPASESIPTPESLKPPSVDLRQDLLEGALNFVSGLPASIAGGLGGVLSLTQDGDINRAADVVRNQTEALTFEPTTQGGDRVAELISKPFAAIEDFADFIGEEAAAGRPGKDEGLPEPFNAIASTALKTTLLGGPALAGAKGRSQALTQKQRTAQAAVNEGYRIPPTDIGGKPVKAAVEGFADQSKTRKQAASMNMAVSNRLANRALGLPEESLLSIEAMKVYRAEQGKKYAALNNAGTIATDSAFFDALNAAVERINKQNPNLRGKGSHSRNAVDLSQRLQKDPRLPDQDLRTFDASEIAANTAALRELADTAFDAKAKVAGQAYRDMAKAYEDLAIRHLERFGDPRLVADFKDARANIAKSYAVQSALEGNNINVHKLKAAARKDAPLSGELKFMADVAEQFPSITRIVTEPPPPVSFIDVLVAGGALSSGSPLLQALGAGTLFKPVIRGGLLSKAGQQSIAPAVTRPGLLPGAAITSGFNQPEQVTSEPSIFNQ